MNTSHYSSLSVMALMASISLGTALADSTDEALNQFYVENMATRLTSEAPLVPARNRLQAKRKKRSRKLARA
jgi:hypothetical protein